MSLVRTALLSLCAAATTSALKISSFTNSGPACPSGDSVTWNGSSTDPVFYLNDYSVSLDTRETVSCELHLVIDGGKAGEAVTVGEVSVWGRLGLASNGATTFYTSAFWSEDAGSPVTKKIESSTTSAFNGNVAIDANLGLSSPCIGSDGHVGILNLNFRVFSEGGKVTFGPQKAGSAVSEHIQLTSAKC
ncbi:unnamed protein product [Parascedosporium putredinis]|uniref:Secreted protein n=1 Tax=Parascedosporium putredinis TaxID=1442378 RepID=A0A9P1M643_9PEZI|nr:unnamed protein product [Parascedosporium putredinis]CAI7987985.1 unnamed protein product [Parascedosporium putredinis]